MTVPDPFRRLSPRAAAPALVLATLLPVLLDRLAFPGITWGDPAVAGTLGAASAALCAVFGVLAAAVGWRSRMPETAVLGAALAVLSLALLVGAVQVAVDGSPGIAPAAALALGALVAAPVAGGRGALRAGLRRWRAWITITVLLAGGILWVLATAGPPARPAVTAALVLGAVIAAGPLVRRYDHLARIGRRRAVGVLAWLLATVIVATAVSQMAGPLGAVWWSAHVLDGAVLVGAALVLMHLARRGRVTADVLRSVTAADPLVALEAGLDPVVHAFVAALERKDAGTRDHVVRVAGLATLVAERAGLRPDAVRRVGLGGLLHDIGKLVVPSEILAKPAVLSDEEFAAIRTHPERGAAMVTGSAALREIAPLVRWHHERPDGTGYPDGLRGAAIPFEVAVVSACDAWDAITHTRCYQEGRSPAAARAILQAGAGTQWDPKAVRLVLAAVHDIEEPAAEVAPLHAVGRAPTPAESG